MTAWRGEREARPPKLPNAACRAPHNAPLFASGATAKAAKAVCNRCFDRPECLAWGLEHEDHGIWGGHGPRELKAIRSRFGIKLEEL